MVKQLNGPKPTTKIGKAVTSTEVAAVEPPDRAAPKSGTIGSLAKGLRILEYVISAPNKVRLRSVASHFGMDRSAAFRFLATLQMFGYVTKDPETKAYSAGPGLARLRRLVRSRSALIELVRPFLTRLSEQTGQTCYVAMIENNRALLLSVAPGHNIISVRHYVGQLEPLYCTAVGKAILAMLPAAEQNAMIRKLHLKKNTPRTISSKAVLRKELAEIRAAGVAFDECEWREEISCIGAPIMDDSGYPVAAIGLSMADALIKGGPRARTDWIEMVREAATDAGRVMAAADNAGAGDWQQPSATSA